MCAPQFVCDQRRQVERPKSEQKQQEKEDENGEEAEIFNLSQRLAVRTRQVGYCAIINSFHFTDDDTMTPQRSGAVFIVNNNSDKMNFCERCRRRCRHHIHMDKRQNVW